MSSGSRLIRAAWPTSHHVSQLQSLRDVAQQKAYVDCGWVVSSESGDDSLTSASLQNGDLLG